MTKWRPPHTHAHRPRGGGGQSRDLPPPPPGRWLVSERIWANLGFLKCTSKSLISCSSYRRQNISNPISFSVSRVLCGGPRWGSRICDLCKSSGDEENVSLKIGDRGGGGRPPPRSAPESALAGKLHYRCSTWFLRFLTKSNTSWRNTCFSDKNKTM